MVFTWNWGDGTGDVTGGRVNQHVYQLNGTIPPEGTTQTITCTIRDPAAQTAVDTAIVTVFAPLQNHAPTACYTANTSARRWYGRVRRWDLHYGRSGDGDCTFANNRLFYRLGLRQRRRRDGGAKRLLYAVSSLPTRHCSVYWHRAKRESC